MLFHAVNLGIRNASDFHDRGERDSKKTAADAEQQCLNTRKSERRTKLNCCAAALLRRNMNGTLEAAEYGSNDIHADAPARNFRHFRSGAESRLENEIENFLPGQALGRFRFQDFLFNGARAQLSRVDTPTVVADFNDHLGALMIGVEIDGTACGLAGSQALAGRLDTMVNRITDEMHERLGKTVENALIEVSVLAREFQGHILATFLGNVADDAREPPEELLDGHHADFQYALVELIQDAGLKGHGVRKFGAQGIARVLAVKFGKRAMEHGLSDDQFADQIHDRIDAGSLDAKRAFSNSGRCGTGTCVLRYSSAFCVVGGPGDKFRRLRLQQIAEQFMFGNLRGRGTFQTHIGNNRRNPAALQKPFFRLRGRQGGLDDFHGCGGQVVLGPQGDEGTAAVKNVSNELESRGAHQAVWIDTKSDVVNGLSAMHGFGDHELLVFRPGKLRGQWRRRRASVLRGSDRVQQLSNHDVQRFHGRWFGLPLIGGEHRAK